MNFTDDRAVSTAVSHAITIGITSIMLTGLMIGASQMVDDQRQYVVERGLEDVSSAVVSDLMRIDQFNTTNAPMSFTADHPERIGGSHYSIDVHPGRVKPLSTSTPAPRSGTTRFRPGSRTRRRLRKHRRRRPGPGGLRRGRGLHRPEG